MDALTLRLEGPMISFGGPIVDNRGVIQNHPPLSMLTGLIGNALGYNHGEFDALQSLQNRIRFAARCDQAGERFTDYQTVDLGQDFMKKSGWTTRGEREDRRGGKKSSGTHLRYRQYLAGASYTVALTLRPPDASGLDLAAIERALKRPERPLFIGRKTCLPSRPIFAGRIEADSVLDALRKWPSDGASSEDAVEAWWPADLDETVPDSRMLLVNDQRDWANQVHTGQRSLRHGMITVRRSVGNE